MKKEYCIYQLVLVEIKLQQEQVMKLSDYGMCGIMKMIKNWINFKLRTVKFFFFSFSNSKVKPQFRLADISGIP